jgi:hypothetical protein
VTARSETVQTIVALVPYLPDPTRIQLRKMLANSIAAPTAAELREARLGLLIELVTGGDSQDANTDSYEALRAKRAAAGQTWPSRSQLSRAYGTWLRALDAATTLAGEATGGAPSHCGRPRVRHRYSRRDLVLALQRSHIALGMWPSPREYQRWRSLAVRAARNHGRAAAAIPSHPVIARRFGTWSRALALAEAGDAANHTTSAAPH